MRGKVGHFFDIKSSTKHRASAESNTDFCQERIIQWRDVLVHMSQSFSKTPHFPSFTCIGFFGEQSKHWHLQYSRPPICSTVAKKNQ